MKKVKKIDYSKYRVIKFAPTLFSSQYHLLGCGCSLLATVTGLSPLSFKNPNKQNPDDWKDSYILHTLRKYGWTVIKIKPEEVTNTSYIEDNITKNHIVIISQHYTKTDASWAILYQGLYIHNGSIIKFDSYELLSRPLITAYIIWHPKYIQ